MVTITIPKKLAKKGDLIVIPREDYDAILKRQKIVPVVGLTFSERKALDRGRKEIAKGEYLTLEKIEYELGSPGRKKR